jgi:hypothetical protein
MNSLYLYCIRAAGLDSLETKRIKGAIEDSPVFTLPYKDLEAVVSTINLDELSEADIAQKAKEDVKWITREAQTHHHVLSEAMKGGAVIPMHFGTIFKSQEALEALLEKRYQEFLDLLGELHNKEEWSVKVYVSGKDFIEKITQQDPELQAQAEDDYFAEIALEEKSDEVIERELDAVSRSFFETLQKESFRARINRPLNNELLKHLGVQDVHDTDVHMILNSAYLLEPGAIKDFLSALENLQKEYPEFIFNYTGPWPAFNFV